MFTYLLKKVETAYILLLLKAPNRLFAFFFNVFQIFHRSQLRIQFRGSYFALQDKTIGILDWKTSRKRQTVSSFLFGAEKRTINLRKVYFLDLIDFRPGDRVIDCGANVGDLYLTINDIEPLVHYIAFEPSREEFGLLSKNASRGSELHNIALWNQDGEIMFWLSPEGADSSAIMPERFEGTVNVRSARLEHWLGDKVRLLKLEAEGAELEVLQGCGELLPNIEWISADLGPERGVDSIHTLPEVCNFLLSKGFVIREFSAERVTVLFHNQNFEPNT